jgi:hypothetical protein
LRQGDAPVGESLATGKNGVGTKRERPRDGIARPVAPQSGSRNRLPWSKCASASPLLTAFPPDSRDIVARKPSARMSLQYPGRCRVRRCPTATPPSQHAASVRPSGARDRIAGPGRRDRQRPVRSDHKYDDRGGNCTCDKDPKLPQHQADTCGWPSRTTASRAEVMSGSLLPLSPFVQMTK